MFRVVITGKSEEYYLTDDGGLTPRLLSHRKMMEEQLEPKRFPSVESACIRLEQVRGRYKGFDLLFHIECDVCADGEESYSHSCVFGWREGNQAQWNVLGSHIK